MHAQNFIVNKGSDGHAVENILELFPKTDTVPIFALVVKPVDSIDLSTLVISSQQEKVLLEFNLVREQEDDCLQ